MVLYGHWVYRQFGRGLDTDENLADSVYFLGFVFTLSSLLVSQISFLTKAGMPAVNHDKLIADAIGNFGIALVTTLVGIFIRMLLMQGRGSQDAEEDLEVAFGDLSDEIRLTLQNYRTLNQELLTFTGASRQVLSEQLRNLERIGTQITQSLNTNGEELQKALKTNSTALLEELTGHTKKASAAVSGFVKKLNDFRPPAELFTETFEDYFVNLGAQLLPLAEVLASLTWSVGEEQKAITLAVGQVKAFGDAVQAAPQSLQTFETLAGNLNRFGAELGKVSPGLQLIPELLKNIKDLIQEVTSTLQSIKKEQADWGTKETETLKASIADFQGVVVSFFGTLTRVTQQYHQELTRGR
ncbi:MAG: hypothetical protein A2600_10875 [Candidatus Lambdaproteobacteria bacterium RIFOXYD1_FULL_56_27]|uniref:Uncharacterized protein n=1 Tax=Candidatus Lambdaproteobacteria bacterium RIFOXYD2_FULL_56_26 TaxID=1817773 RepID=A0A1F6H1K0_9PROT|nr:MAG: hypothetical protein A2557_10620 [Candidatus Lambdaproteobacteria bacterium RIFOXYD2_FULL_56_26]OGH05720.1 MAG: hypothetical protein A2426_04310 [Candidatus Lambdaproteobacteria bacterium RIFOXYC1_FULL_56_13]OGH08413.1 MAG: hypothetical protein A2600_10875 [Candidatus Lambdaproteobacteria bacterium RIFOXYD1_FULL_56_27]